MKFSLYLFILSLITFSCAQPALELPKLPSDGIAIYYDLELKPFYHGVASGDPLSDALIIWTRVTPEDSLERVDVAWLVAKSDEFTDVVSRGTAEAIPSRDYTVKVDVTGLEPGTEYFYKFIALGDTSLIGKAKTSPQGLTDSVKFGIVSCSNYEWGYFTSYRKLAEKDLDAVLHLGDYIYEYGPGSYGDTTLNRKHFPE